MATKRKTLDKYPIWTNIPWDFMTDEEWEVYFRELANANDWEYDGMSDEFKCQLIYDEIGTILECEIANLDIPTTGSIIAIADLGLWNGRRSGYKILNEHNVNAIFKEMQWDECEFYADRYNVRMVNHHHDGTNYVMFRELKPNVNHKHFLDMIYEGKPISSKTLCRYTRSLRPYIAKVYGW